MKFLKCGCIPVSYTKDNEPICLIHNCTETVEITNEDIKNRKAKCNYCGRIVTSSFDLPFFKYCPDKESDEFFDGCFGWD